MKKGNMTFRNNMVFITGNEAIILGAQAVEANFMSGYPITPVTEILEDWAKLHAINPKKYPMIQAEDEISAGFNVIGAVLAGAKAFTTTAGPGHILMQDPLTMAEAMRLPFVLVAMQRGGPSTGTVIYSQQEVTLACFGGNGEGLRIVYSIANPQEAYIYMQKAFKNAWQYRFPVIVLGDGYIAKMKQKVKLISNHIKIKSEKIVGKIHKPVNLRNCYNIEGELAEVLNRNIKDFDNISNKIVESESFKCRDAEIILVAHGIVSQIAKKSVQSLREKNQKVGLFRPITLRPFDYTTLSRLAAKVRKIIILESANGHFERIVKQGLYGITRIETYFKPVEAISEEEIISKIM